MAHARMHRNCDFTHSHTRGPCRGGLTPPPRRSLPGLTCSMSTQDLSVAGKPRDLSPIEAQRHLAEKRRESPMERLATTRQREQRLRSCSSGSEGGSDGGQASTSPATRSNNCYKFVFESVPDERSLPNSAARRERVYSLSQEWSSGASDGVFGAAAAADANQSYVSFRDGESYYYSDYATPR